MSSTIYRLPPLNIGIPTDTFTLSEKMDWGVKRIVGGTEKWNPENAGEGILFVVGDTGASEHPDMPSPIFKPSFARARKPGFDGNAHGTHVGGTILARKNNSGLVGVAPAGDYGSIQILGDDGSNTSNKIADGYRWLLNYWTTEGHKKYRACVLNLSIGGGFDPETDKLLKQMNEVRINGVLRPILVVAAIGNSGGSENQERGDHPGISPWTIAVASHDEDLNRSDFSSVSKHVDCVAPGTEILSHWLNERTNRISGTSMATPHVAAAAGLVIQSDPHNKDLQTAGGMREFLESRSIDMGRRGKDRFFGHGRVNMDKMIKDQDFQF